MLLLQLHEHTAVLHNAVECLGFPRRASGDRDEAANVVIVLTDGNSTVERENVASEAARLRDVARVLVVGVRQPVCSW